MIGGESMENMFGYIRVSSKDQNEDRQMIAMAEFGVKAQNIFVDKVSGKDFNRPAYQELMSKLKVSDTLVVKSIDRLGRNYSEILEQWRKITKDKQVNIVVLDMPLLDTRKNQDLVGTLIADIVLQLLSYVAQTERDFIRQRQAEGIAAAKARGVKFGRKPTKRPDNFESIRNKWKDGELSVRSAAKLLRIAPSTFLRWAKKN